METLALERPEDAPGLLIASLNRPEKLNAVNGQMYRDLQQVCRDLQDDGSVHAVMFTGTGRAFSSGADVSRPAPEEPPLPPPPPVDAFTRRLRGAAGNRTADLIEGLDQVTVAAVNGLAIGGAVALLAAADIRIAAESAWFSLPEMERGIPLGLGALPRLVRAVGPARALELIACGERFTAAEALAWGFVNHVYSDAEFRERAKGFAASLAAKDPLALGLIKTSINAIAQVTTPSALAFADRDLLSLAGLARQRGQQ
jgi:enoyl-CoA hydratase/carnithine racemase